MLYALEKFEGATLNICKKKKKKVQRQILLYDVCVFQATVASISRIFRRSFPSGRRTERILAKIFSGPWIFDIDGH
jgi:hypothetical protein